MFISNKKNKNLGFTLVEILIASAIMTTMIFALISAVQKGIQLSYYALKQTQASLLLEEGAEAVKSIRDANWTNISSLTLNTDYYLSFDNGTNVWSLSTIPTAIIDSIFTRKVLISSVLRDGTDKIASSGTLDIGTKKITITTSWPISDGTTFSSNLIFYIANIF